MPKDAAARVAKPKSSAIRYFDAAGHTLRGGFKEYWQTQGGLAQFGYPITEEFEEGGYTVQYFERARFEWHPELALPYRVKLAPLTSNVVESRLISDPFRPQSALPQVGARYIPETMHNLGTQFEDYWQSHGGAGVFGYPISEPFREVNAADGKEYLVQYFPRQRLEYHPELPEPYKVSLGLVGVEYAREQGWLR